MAFVAAAGALLADLVEEQYDIVSWDLCGVGDSVYIMEDYLEACSNSPATLTARLSVALSRAQLNNYFQSSRRD
jgi:hypothetical protein